MNWHILLLLKILEEKSPLTEWSGSKLSEKCFQESINVYQEDLKPIILKFSKSPKANFMASPDLVKYFHKESEEGLIFVENLQVGERFDIKMKFS